MKLTNKAGLPEALVRALENDTYSNEGSDYTPSILNKPTQLIVLEERHISDLEEDAEDGLYRLYGQVAHGILERANMADLAEKRFFMDIAGKKISAQIDTLSITDGVLSDFKFTTSWGFTADKTPKAEWIAQLNIQLELLRRNGLDAKKLQIIGLLRDWQISKAKSDRDYPQSPIAVLQIPMWPREQTIAYIEMRIAEIEKARLTPDAMLPECSEDDRYADPPIWRVKKRGGARAINGGVHLSEEGAQAVCAKNPGTYVEFKRDNPTKRCVDYCSVSKFCKQYQRLTANSQTGAVKTEESA